MLIIYNLVGLVIGVIAFLVTALIANVVPISKPGLLGVIFGLVAVILDVAYRWKSEHGHWIFPGGGGSVFFLPVWGLGIIIFVTGLAAWY